MLEDLSYIDCLDLLRTLDIKNINSSGNEISFSCPSDQHFHGDRNPSARMNSHTSAGLCHSCGKSWNAVTFLSWHKSIPETVARRVLEERYGGGISAPIDNLEDEVLRIMNKEIVVEEKRIPPAESWLETFREGIHVVIEPQEYLTKRGFGQQIVEKWNLGYDIFSKRITIPIRDHLGNLVGFKGRSLEDNSPYPRYMILGDTRNQQHYGFQPYKKSEYVFGLDKWNDHHDIFEHNCTAILCEGELNVIAMNQHGFKDAVGIAGSEFSDKQRQLIVEGCSSAVIYLDNDKAGEKGTKKVVEMLSPYIPLRVVQNAPGDAAELDAQTVIDLIRNAESALLLQTQGLL
jgi:DNA primase